MLHFPTKDHYIVAFYRANLNKFQQVNVCNIQQVNVYNILHM